MAIGFKRPARVSAVALGLALFASACGGAATEDAAAPADTGSNDAEVVEDTGSAGLPQLIGDTVAGAQLDTNDLAGQDVAIWFWAPW